MKKREQIYRELICKHFFPRDEIEQQKPETVSTSFKARVRLIADSWGKAWNIILYRNITGLTPHPFLFAWALQIENMNIESWFLGGAGSSELMAGPFTFRSACLLTPATHNDRCHYVLCFLVLPFLSLLLDMGYQCGITFYLGIGNVEIRTTLHFIPDEVLTPEYEEPVMDHPIVV
jgi:hypothetical protein